MIDYPPINSSRMLYSQVTSLLIYQSIFDNPIGEDFTRLLQILHQEEIHNNPRQITAFNCLKAYGNWFKKLAYNEESWGDYLLKQILLNQNPFSQLLQKTPLEKLPKSLINSIENDLKILENLYNCTPDKICQWVQIAAQLPHLPIAWEVENRETNFLNESENWSTKLAQLACYYQRRGVGIFAQFYAFRWQEGKLKVVEQVDPVKTEELVGYQWQKEILLKNTEFLLSDYPALSVLLYGSRGSGKSSLVKSLLHKYADRGLRLIEVNKHELKNLNAILELLYNQPQKFIIYVDDLSFEEDNESFKSLKVLLEGGLTARPQNVVIYATSNRRHLIKENLEDRPSKPSQEEVYSWDSVEEKLSFSDRFGLTLTFEPANQTTYLEIVHHLANLAGIKIDPEQLNFKAKQWATRHNGRSGRTARQFIDFLVAELAMLRP
jgi:hypothetical protein